MMMLSDVAAGRMTVAVLLLHTTGRLQIWHLCVTGAFVGGFHAVRNAGDLPDRGAVAMAPVPARAGADSVARAMEVAVT